MLCFLFSFFTFLFFLFFTCNTSAARKSRIDRQCISSLLPYPITAEVLASRDSAFVRVPPPLAYPYRLHASTARMPKVPRTKSGLADYLRAVRLHCLYRNALACARNLLKSLRTFAISH